MAELNKVTVSNFKPTTSANSILVRAKQFNELVDALNEGTGDLTVNDATVSGNLVVTGTSTFNGAITLGDAAADTLTVTAAATYSDVIAYSNATAITAFATGAQASATALTEELNNVTVCATAGDSVKLPAAVAGKHIWVKNSGAAALDIFPATSDSIDALAVNLAVRIQPGASINFYAKDATVWESDKDVSLTLNAPTTVKGQLELKAADSAGNTVTTITNASQAAARTYTIPDAGAAASFVMSEGASTINALRTFGDGIATDTIAEETGAAGVTIDSVLLKDNTVLVGAGAVGTPSIQVGAADTGLYLVSATQTGISQDGALIAVVDSLGFQTESVRHRVNLGTTPVGTVTIKEYSTGRDIITELTLTNFIVGALAGAAAALGVGNIVYAFPAGQHFELVNSLSSIVLTAAGTAVATDTGLGSVIATGAISVLSGTATFEDRLTGQAINTAAGGGAAVSALTAATAGIGLGISLNVAGSVKNVFLNSAGTWNADNTGNLTATGTIVLKWAKM